MNSVPLFMKRKPRLACLAKPALSQANNELPALNILPKKDVNQFMLPHEERSFIPIPPIHHQLLSPLGNKSSNISQQSSCSQSKHLPMSRYMANAVDKDDQSHDIDVLCLQQRIDQNFQSFISSPNSIISREKIQNSAKQFKPCNKRRIDSLVFEEDMIKALPNKLTKMTQKENGRSAELENKMPVSLVKSSISTYKKQFVKKQEVDNTLRLLTATIEGMKYWSQYSTTLPLLFEIIGILNSAVTTDELNYYKQFLLKDDKNFVTCLFCEIDRTLPKLNRGQWYRCVGNFDRKKNVLKCVSIRIATDSEKNFRHNMVQVCDKAMRTWVSAKPRLF